MNENQNEETVNIKDPNKKKPVRKMPLIIKIIIAIILILTIYFNIYITKLFLNKKSDNNKGLKNSNINENHKVAPLKNKIRNKYKKYNIIKHKTKKKKKQNDKFSFSKEKIEQAYALLKKEMKNPIFSEMNKKRTFELRYPLPKEIKCFEHLVEGSLLDMMVFTSFLTKNTTFFEYGSGCSTIIAKYYCKKTYAVEANIKWYNKGIKNGLKDILIFKDLKCDGSGGVLSAPGKKSTLEDWKNFFQAYKKEYNADVILIDGRFRVSCAFDIFSKIRNDTIVFLHECNRPQYSVIKKYYDYIHQYSDRLCLLKKKKNITKIPLEIQKKYWKQML
jgi:hypothetical protein